MSFRRAVTVACLVFSFVACGHKEEPVGPMMMKPTGAVRGEAVSAQLELLGNPDGFNPLSLNRAVKVSAKAAQMMQVALPVPLSAQAAWVALRGNADAKLSGNGRSFSLAAGGADAWQLLPLTF